MEDEWARFGASLLLLGGDSDDASAELRGGLRVMASALPPLVLAVTAISWLLQADPGSPVIFAVALVCGSTAWLLHPRSR